jgi:hypothetical protein
MQFQMQATVAQVGYLSFFSLVQGCRLFKVTYSEDFMREASAVLQHVVTEYLKPGVKRLPYCNITKKHIDLQQPWFRMMNRLQDCISSVKDLGTICDFSR